jgi:hypothetical protein
MPPLNFKKLPSAVGGRRIVRLLGLSGLFQIQTKFQNSDGPTSTLVAEP